MATTDKHPPLDPKRWSTNKKVKAKPYKPLGVGVKTATGPKRVKVGDKNTTSAKSEKPPENPANKKFAKSVSDQKVYQDLYYDTLKSRRGFTGAEARVLQSRKKPKKPFV